MRGRPPVHTLRGEPCYVSKLAEICGVDINTIRYHLKTGKSFDEIYAWYEQKKKQKNCSREAIRKANRQEREDRHVGRVPTRYVTFRGEQMTLGAFARMCARDPEGIWAHIQRGMSADEYYDGLLATVECCGKTMYLRDFANKINLSLADVKAMLDRGQTAQQIYDRTVRTVAVNNRRYTLVAAARMLRMSAEELRTRLRAGEDPNGMYRELYGEGRPFESNPCGKGSPVMLLEKCTDLYDLRIRDGELWVRVSRVRDCALFNASLAIVESFLDGLKALDRLDGFNAPGQHCVIRYVRMRDAVKVLQGL